MDEEKEDEEKEDEKHEHDGDDLDVHDAEKSNQTNGKREGRQEGKGNSQRILGG